MSSTNSSLPLVGKVIVVSGSSHGIGRAVALRLAGEGAAVVVNGSGTGAGGQAESQRVLSQLLEEVESLPGDAFAFVGSVADDSAAKELIESAVGQFGHLDGLVNCAGIAEPAGSSVEAISDEDWRRVRRVHLDGTFSCCRHALPHLIARGGGSIINTTSHAHLGIYGGSAYGAAKGAINSLTWEVAADFAEKKIRCNAISPGARTRLSSGSGYEAQIEDLVARGLLSREMAAMSLNVAGPEGCASLYAYLLSDAAAEISGEVFSASGGYVGVFPKPRERLLVFKDTDSPWALSELAEQLPAALKAAKPAK
ncbi:MAG: 3-oxoacyl-[acyl-carrier protein] reductase [Myxococcota bacterium]